MKYVLIDTCIIKSSLISKSDYSKDLRQIKHWIDNDLLVLCSPEQLISEWNKHKELEEKIIERALKVKTRDLHLTGLYELNAIESGEEKARRVLHDQINDINKIILRGEQIKTKEQVSHIIIQHQTQRLPPFHKKSNSLNDALLIFTTLDFADSNEIAELFFVSSNHTDFGETNDSEQILNHEITKYYPNVSVKYFTTSKSFISDLINDGLPKLEETYPQLINQSPTIQIYIDHDQHLVSQLQDLVNILYDELEFIPLHILTQQYPFKDRFNSRYNNFVLHSYNEEFVYLFKSIKITNQEHLSIIKKKYFNGIENIESKLTSTIKKLTSNLIYHISTPQESDYFDFRLFDNSICSCARCQIEKFSFKTIDFKIEVKESRIENLMNQAYAHYKMGHFKNAFRIYKQAEDDALKEKKELSLFVIRYNLIHLASFLEHNYYGDEESKRMANELRSIDLSNSICETKNGFHAEFQKWMLNDHYMLHFHAKISEIKQQLIDHYQNTLHGGSGSNNYVNDLINQYAQLHQFLQQNTIINDCYKPFLDIVEMVIEGLFTSFAVQGERSSKIDSFNDWTLTQIIKYGRTPSIRRLANRYKIRELHYGNYNEDHESIKELIIRLFDQFDIASQKLRLYAEPNYDHFSNDYNRWLNNALYIVAHTDFDEAFIRKFTDTFISYYESNTHRLSTTEIGGFLVCKFPLFTHTQRKKLLLLGMKEEQLMRSYYLQNFAQLSEEHNFSFKLAKKDINSITQRPFNQLSNIVSLVHVYRCLSEIDQKTLITQKITNELSDSFRLDIWNSAVLYDVIPFKNEDLLKAVDILIPKKNIPRKPGNPFGGSRYSGGLDQFINVCYDKDIDMSDSKFDGLRENSNYYKWLLNVDGFDYSLFDSSWLMEFGTKPYLKRFSKSDILKRHVETLLSDPKEKNKEALKDAFMDIYILKGWEK